MHKGIVLAAHGSRVTASNDEIGALAARLSASLSSAEPLAESAPVVLHGFLELSEPSIDDAIDQCSSLGVTQLHVLPYFLAAGRHVQTDIPEIIAAASTRHPHMTITLAQHIGASELMLDMILRLCDSSSTTPQS